MRAGALARRRPPFGYDLVSHKLVVNAAEADVVRQLYNAFVEFRCYTRLERDCLAGGVFSKTWITSHGVQIQGVPMRAASIRKILCNPVYAGYLPNKGELSRDIHKPIIDEALWRQVAALLERKVREGKKEAKEDLSTGSYLIAQADECVRTGSIRKAGGVPTTALVNLSGAGESV